MMTDPVADMLTRIRNAGQAKHKWVDMPVSKLKVEVARLLEESHFVHTHKGASGWPFRCVAHLPQISR